MRLCRGLHFPIEKTPNQVKSKKSHLTFDQYQTKQQWQSYETIPALGRTQTSLTWTNSWSLFGNTSSTCTMETCFPHDPGACPNSDKMPTNIILHSSVWFLFLVNFFFLFMERTAASKWMRSMVYICQAEGHRMNLPLKCKLYFDNHLQSFTDYFKLGSW